MDGYLVVSIPDSGAGFPELELRSAFNSRIMVDLARG